MTDDEIKVAANGQSDPEYATVIFLICGIKESFKKEWTRDGKHIGYTSGAASQPPDGLPWSVGVNYRWVGDQDGLRHQLELLIKVCKQRVVANVQAHQEMVEAKDRVLDFFEQAKHRSLELWGRALRDITRLCWWQGRKARELAKRALEG